MDLFYRDKAKTTSLCIYSSVLLKILAIIERFPDRVVSKRECAALTPQTRGYKEVLAVPLSSWQDINQPLSSLHSNTITFSVSTLQTPDLGIKPYIEADLFPSQITHPTTPNHHHGFRRRHQGV